MNENLSALITSYCLGSQAFIEKCNEYSKADLIAIISNLTTIYFNDKNSSFLREYTTLKIAGFQPTNQKLGYNGFKTISPNKIEYCEVKPKNWNPERPVKLDGSGNFTDYTWDRFDNDMEKNPIMLISGFREGKILYCISFHFNNVDFSNRLIQILEKKFPNRIRNKGDYLRSASFNFNHYIQNAQIIYCDENLPEHKEIFNKKFYEWIIKNAKN